MNKPLSPCHRPWLWAARQVSIIVALGLLAWTMNKLLPSSTWMMVASLVVAAMAALLGLKFIVDVLVAAFSSWFAELGSGIGYLVASIRSRSGRKAS